MLQFLNDIYLPRRAIWFIVSSFLIQEAKGQPRKPKVLSTPPAPPTGNQCLSTNTAYIDCCIAIAPASTCGKTLAEMTPGVWKLIVGCINSYAGQINPVETSDYCLATTKDTQSTNSDKLIACFPQILTVTPTWVVFDDTLTNSKTVSEPANQEFSMYANPPSGTPDGSLTIIISATYLSSSVSQQYDATVCSPGPLSWADSTFTIPNENYNLGIGAALTINTSSATRNPICSDVLECVQNVNYSVKVASTFAAVSSSVFTSVSSTSIKIQTSSIQTDTSFIFRATDTSVYPNLILDTPFTINWLSKPSVPAPPTSVMSGNNFLISWTSPADGGSAITGYTVAIGQSVSTMLTLESASCTGVTTSCIVPLTTLETAPFNLSLGASVFATVLATNVIGSSAVSPSGNNVVLTRAYANCAVPLGLLNLLNTSVFAYQNAFQYGYSYTSGSGCDGVILYEPNEVEDLTKVTQTNPLTLTWWRAEFLAQTSVQAFLVINRNYLNVLSIRKTVATVGENEDVTLNQKCKGVQAITEGGWWSCNPTMLGKFFGFFSDYIQVVEVMVYSQEVIQMNALSAKMSSQDQMYPAKNALQNLVVTYGTGQKCMASTTTESPTFTMTLKASGMIEGVILVPGENLSWYAYQMDIGVYVEDTKGNQRQCGEKIQNFNTYTEAYCGFVGNKIIVTKFGNNQMLGLCGFGLLSNCDCKLTSFDPKMFSNTTDTFIKGNTTFHATGQEAIPINITISASQFDTVSSICGLADGITSCGLRKLTFVDQLTGLKVTSWPHKGFDWKNPILSFTPNQATQATTVITVILSLSSYPNINRKQDITAIIQKPQQINLKLQAKIGTIANLTLPLLDAQYSYVVTSKQSFSAAVINSDLSVFSGSNDDVGAQQVQIKAVDSDGQTISTVLVKVIFDQNPASTKTGQIIPESSGLDAQSDAQPKPNTGIAPIMTISRVDKKGFFSLDFDQDMNFTQFFAPNKNSSALRNLKGKGGGGGGAGSKGTQGKQTSSDESSNQNENTDEYLLSDEQLGIKINSGGEINQTMLDFDWQTVNISSRQIQIQLLFVHPLFISSQKGLPESVAVKLLNLDAFRSLENGLTVKEESVKIILPCQLELTEATVVLEATGNTAEEAGQSAMVVQLVLSLLLGGVMTQMWTMVNGFQILVAYPLLNLVMPANTYLVLNNLSDLNDFAVIQTQGILLSMFTFSSTESPGFGFEQMGVFSKRLILYLGNIFLLILAGLALAVLYAILWLLRGQWKVFSRLRSKIGRFVYWKFVIRLILEGCLDLAVGILMSYQDIIFKLPSDTFDFVVTFVFTPMTFGLPLASFYFLRIYEGRLQDEKFEKKFGTLWEGYKIKTREERRSSIIMITWFVSRRLLLAIVVTQLQQQTCWLQLASNLFLTLMDVSMKTNFDPFESREGGIMDRCNDAVCLVLSYCMFLFTDFVSEPDTRSLVGWGFNGLIGLMLGANLLLISLRGFQLTVNTAKRYLAIRENMRIMEWHDIQMKEPLTMLRKATNFLQVSDLVYLDANYGTESSSEEELEYESEEEPKERPAANQVVNQQSQPVNEALARNQRPAIVEEVKEHRPKYTTLTGEDLRERRSERIEKVTGIFRSLALDEESVPQSIRLHDFVDLLPSDFSDQSPIARKSSVKFVASLFKSESDIPVDRTIQLEPNQKFLMKIRPQKAPISFEVEGTEKKALVFE